MHKSTTCTQTDIWSDRKSEKQKGRERERRIVCDIIKRREGYEVRESEVIDAWCNQDMELRGKASREKRGRDWPLWCPALLDVKYSLFSPHHLLSYRLSPFCLNKHTQLPSLSLAIIQIYLSFLLLCLCPLLSIYLSLILFIVLHGCVFFFFFWCLLEPECVSSLTGFRKSCLDSTPIENGLIMILIIR